MHTSYLNATKSNQYQYQEMGPILFPMSIEDPGTNETIQIPDHNIVFQLAVTLDEMNGNDPEFAVNFMPWTQNSMNTSVAISKRRPDGTVPGVAGAAPNPSVNDNVTITHFNATKV